MLLWVSAGQDNSLTEQDDGAVELNSCCVACCCSNTMFPERKQRDKDCAANLGFITENLDSLNEDLIAIEQYSFFFSDHFPCMTAGLAHDWPPLTRESGHSESTTVRTVS